MLGYYESLPSVKNLTISSITDAVQTSIVAVKNEIYHVNEPEELKSDKDLTKKQGEIEATLNILSTACNNLKKQRDLHT